MKHRLIIAGFVALAVVAVGGGIYTSATNHQLRVSLCDVGQGDALFIHLPTGQDILVDGGPDQSVLRCLGSVMPFFDRSIDLVILTHPHDDHLVGLLSVVERYTVGEIITSGVQTTENPVISQWQALIAERAIPVRAVAIGDSWQFAPDLTLDVLWPPPLGSQTIPADELNNTSVVTLLTYANTRLLFTGDAEAPVERALLASGRSLDVEWLKVGHHGSSTSSTADLVAKTSPAIAALSLGTQNSFGHPAPEIIRRLESVGATVVRTDRDGTVTWWSNGSQIVRQPGGWLGRLRLVFSQIF